jgi:hypothetical protein
MTRLLVFFVALFVFACQPADPADRLAGRWGMERILEEGEDVSARHNPAGERWIAFAADGTFESGGEPYGPNAGRWTFDPETNELYLDSDAGEGDDSYWIVTLDGDEMRWKGTRSDFTERFELVHVRQP